MPAGIDPVIRSNFSKITFWYGPVRVSTGHPHIRGERFVCCDIEASVGLLKEANQQRMLTFAPARSCCRSCRVVQLPYCRSCRVVAAVVLS